MARRCELTGEAVLTGNNVSHAKRRTKRRFLPNLCNVTLESEALKKRVRLTISAHALRSVEHRGGLDAYLLKAGDDELSLKARRLKRDIAKKQADAGRSHRLAARAGHHRHRIRQRELHDQRSLERAEIIVRHQCQHRLARRRAVSGDCFHIVDVRNCHWHRAALRPRSARRVSARRRDAADAHLDALAEAESPLEHDDAAVGQRRRVGDVEAADALHHDLSGGGTAD